MELAENIWKCVFLPKFFKKIEKNQMVIVKHLRRYNKHLTEGAGEAGTIQAPPKKSGLKVKVHHGMKKYPNEIFLQCLFTKIRLFVCIFRKLKNVSLLTFLAFDTIWQLLSEKCYNTKWPALDDERLELKRFFKYWLVCLWQAKECFVNKQLTYISKVIA